MNRIITIGREFGSGGRELGRRLAEELNIEYYDKEIISEIAKHTKLSEEYVSEIIEHRIHHLYPITIGRTLTYANDYQIKQIQRVYQAQCDILKELAEKSSCVIVGRCADYILSEYKPFKMFVYADMESKITRCIKRNQDKQDLSRKQFRKQIIRIDKDRAKYYEYYTGLKWGDKSNYDLCINTTDTVIKDIVPIIAKMFKD